MEKKIAEKYIKSLIRLDPGDPEGLRQAKRDLAKQYNTNIIANSLILEYYNRHVRAKDNSKLLRLLRKREIRTLSGIAPITVLTKPYPCPGRCVYCPTEARMPKSYIASEPAAQRAARLKFNPYNQVKMRIDALEANGHSVNKIELIVLGGTWSYYDKKYQDWFITRCFEAANGKPSKNLFEAQRINEKAKHKIIGLTLETRPDYVTKDELWRMRKLGCTHVQIGVQTLEHEILDFIKRDDSIENIKRATNMLRDFGFKITYHLMPGLPGATPKSDLATFKKVFSDPGFQPDMLKIYPCVVIKSALLYQWYKKGKFKPYKGKTLANLLIKIKKDIPPYVRINRLIRDIPGNEIVDGNLVTNLRQMLHNEGVVCRCIRCREARKELVDEKDAKLVIRKYRAGLGTEYFISFESKDYKKLYAFIRLRLPDKKTRQASDFKITRFFDQREITVKGDELAFDVNTALIRELHTYGELIPVGSKKKAVQHIGFGKRLMIEAEKIAKQKGYKKIAVISGIGVREYYKKLGYKLDQTYLSKDL
ncbi:MAG: tRNA uridine(34) 5-carboxymethylaminomethyl modification radical SAM/GNAT enzyme Elp3 [bacterium]|nr:tRNA uridine(34) 5-carboxymethylaminomethyl modification radical SAM/GNAT enzyme Elp3 [bacterium]